MAEETEPEVAQETEDASEITPTGLRSITEHVGHVTEGLLGLGIVTLFSTAGDYKVLMDHLQNPFLFPLIAGGYLGTLMRLGGASHVDAIKAGLGLTASIGLLEVGLSNAGNHLLLGISDFVSEVVKTPVGRGLAGGVLGLIAKFTVGNRRLDAGVVGSALGGAVAGATMDNDQAGAIPFIGAGVAFASVGMQK